MCVSKDTACHDEKVVYHIAELPDKPGLFSVGADKIVDGKAINIGTLEFRYDEDVHVLVGEYSQGKWRLNATGEEIDGTLTP